MNFGFFGNPKRQDAPQAVDSFLDRFRHIPPVRVRFEEVRKSNDDAPLRVAAKRRGI